MPGPDRAANACAAATRRSLLGERAALEPPAGTAGDVLRREQNHLAQHAGRMDYRRLALTGPIGSGAVESACRQRQCRFKRAGQFWTEAGLRHLCALQEARRNHHWDQLWNPDPLTR